MKPEYRTAQEMLAMYAGASGESQATQQKLRCPRYHSEADLFDAYRTQQA